MFLLAKGRIQTADPDVAFCKHGEEGELSLTSLVILLFLYLRALSIVLCCRGCGGWSKLLHSSFKFVVLCLGDGNWKPRFILNISSTGDGEGKDVLGKQFSTADLLLIVLWEAVWVKQGGGWVFARRRAPSFPKRQVSAASTARLVLGKRKHKAQS